MVSGTELTDNTKYINNMESEIGRKVTITCPESMHYGSEGEIRPVRNGIYWIHTDDGAGAFDGGDFIFSENDKIERE